MAEFLGLDISKDTIDACLLDSKGEHVRKVSNNVAGFKQIINWLKNRKANSVHACMEATGSYYENIAETLSDAGFIVSVVNPTQIKSFGTTKLVRAKTDSVDAKLIAQFCQTFNPSEWIPLTPEQRKLRGLVRLCGKIKETRASYRVQLQTPNIVAEARRSIEDIVDNLTDQIERLEDEIDKHIDGDGDGELRRRRDLLCTVTGIAKTTAAVILVEVPNIEDFSSSKAIAAFAGLSSRTHRSGTSVRGSGAICKTGPGRLRSALWWPAIVAIRCEGPLHDFADRLRALGKPNKKIIVAVMRKLLVIAYGVLKSGRAFDGALTTP